MLVRLRGFVGSEGLRWLVYIKNTNMIQVYDKDGGQTNYWKNTGKIVSYTYPNGSEISTEDINSLLNNPSKPWSLDLFPGEPNPITFCTIKEEE